ncbi:MAG: DUF421 domain-containing protein [Sphingobacteriales bacterium]|nr:MAG: DUF421 domain-containing protein [Sphingobacteriales bacterium]
MLVYLLLDISAPFDTKSLLFGQEDHSFLPEVLFRALIMFVVVLVSLRLLGKRGVKQLSIFELVIILTLGSASGDPMFYKDVGLLPAIFVFLTVVGLYRFVVYLGDKSSRFNRLVEGKPVCLIEDGIFCWGNFQKEPIALDEFLSGLRVLNVSQLGQIRRAYLETSGELSVFYYPDDSVKPGLPILPESLEKCTSQIQKPGMYSCVHCGHTAEIEKTGSQVCHTCGKNKWVEACGDKRIS